MDEENVQYVFMRLTDALERIADGVEEMAKGQKETNLRLAAVEEAVVGTTGLSAAEAWALGLLTLAVGMFGATAFTRQGRATWVAIWQPIGEVGRVILVFLVALFWTIVGCFVPSDS